MRGTYRGILHRQRRSGSGRATPAGAMQIVALPIRGYFATAAARKPADALLYSSGG